MWVDITALHASLILGLILVIPCLFTHKWPDFSHPLSKGAALMVVFGFLAQVGAVNKDVGWEWTLYLTKLVIVCLLATRLIETKRELVYVLIVIVCSLGFHTTKAGLFSLVAGGVRFDDGLGGAFSGNNGYALASAMITFLLLAVGQIITKPWMRIGFFLASLFSAFTVVSTFSRGGFLALAAGSVVYVLAYPRLIPLVVGVVLTGLVSLFFLPIPQGYLDRLSTIGKLEVSSDMTVELEGAITSSSSRLHFWGIALEMAKDHPFGVGLRNYGEAYDAYDSSDKRYGRRRDCHSSYFQMISETGFPGGLLFIWLIFYTCLTLIRVKYRALNVRFHSNDRRLFIPIVNGMLASMTVFMVAGTFGSYALNDLTWYLFALTAAFDRLCSDKTERAPGIPIPNWNSRHRVKHPHSLSSR